MAYETATASGVNDLLDKLRVFAIAHGWTIDYHGPRTNAGGASQGNGLNALALRKNGTSWVLYHATTYSGVPVAFTPGPWIVGYLYDGAWTASNGTDAQSRSSARVLCNNLPGPYVGYHFFSDPAQTYLHVAVEVVSGRYAHFHIGQFERAALTGSPAYAAATNYSFSTSAINNWTDLEHGIPFDALSSSSAYQAGGVIRCDSDGISPRYARINGSESAATRAYGGFRSSSSNRLAVGMIQNTPPSALTARSMLVPHIISISRNGSDLQRSIVGTVRDCRVLRIDKMAPGDTMTIGSDQWKVFPVIRKNGPVGVETSQNIGFAYRIAP